MREAYSGVPVFVTGHTGFMGSWLVLWLHALGARVTGYSLPPPTRPSFHRAAGLDALVRHVRGDVREGARLARALARAEPRVVFHLAAQSLVGRAREAPSETIHVNAGGTVNLLEGVRAVSSVESVVVVTSDKCYARPHGAAGACREGDPLGGGEPYAASKAMAELAAAAYLETFFRPAGGGAAHRSDARPAVGLATVRAGNVIGGGDFGRDRLVPDLVRARRRGRTPELRRPEAVRPWQFVLDPLAGILLLGARLRREGAALSGPWNLGPPARHHVRVRSVAERFLAALGGERAWRSAPGGPPFPETEALRLDSGKAGRRLSWRNVYTLEEGIRAAAAWYRVFLEGAGGEELRAFSLKQLRAYLRSARSRGASWAG